MARRRTTSHDMSTGPGQHGALSRRAFMKGAGATALASALGSPRRLAGADAVDAFSPPTLDASYRFDRSELVEITRPGPIILPDGTAQRSWSRRAYLDLNFEDAAFWRNRALQRLRMKKWDMYHTVTPMHYVNFLMAWVGYAGFCTAFVYDRRSRALVEDARFCPPEPPLEMMRNSTDGRSLFRDRVVRMSFEAKGERRRLRVDWPTFAGRGLSGTIDLHEPADHESICATHPIGRRRAYYSHKINCMPAKGGLRLGDETVMLTPADAFGMLDFGRGHYPDRTFWYWATASGLDAAGKRVGFNLGHGNDPADPAENAVFYDGKTHKIGPVRCHVPPGDRMKPWRVDAEDGRVKLTFVPEKVRTVNVDFGPMYSKGQPAFGRYSGQVTLDSGRAVRLNDLFGLFEWFDQKW